MQTQTGCLPSPEEPRKPRGAPGMVHARLRLIDWAGRDPGLTPPNKAVLLAVVAHADEHGVCTATDTDLARASHTSVPTVQRSLRLLEVERAIHRSSRPDDPRAIRLLPREQPLVVDDESEREREKGQHQQQGEPRDCSPVSSPVVAGQSESPDLADEEFDRLVALLTDWKVTPKVARELVRDFPERIVPQVEAHRHRNVSNPAASLVVAIRQDWPTEVPKAQRQPTPKEREEEARKARERERQAALDVQARLNARKRAEAGQVRKFWEGLSEVDREAFDREAVEASPHRDEILGHGPDSRLGTIARTTARWEHVRRKLGLPPEVES